MIKKRGWSVVKQYEETIEIRQSQIWRIRHRQIYSTPAWHSKLSLMHLSSASSAGYLCGMRPARLTISSLKLNSHKPSYRRSFLSNVWSKIAEKIIFGPICEWYTQKEMFFSSVPLKEKQLRVPSLNLSYIPLQTRVISLWNFENYLTGIEKNE